MVRTIQTSVDGGCRIFIFYRYHRRYATILWFELALKFPKITKKKIIRSSRIASLSLSMSFYKVFFFLCVCFHKRISARTNQHAAVRYRRRRRPDRTNSRRRRKKKSRFVWESGGTRVQNVVRGANVRRNDVFAAVWRRVVELPWWPAAAHYPRLDAVVRRSIPFGRP